MLPKETIPDLISVIMPAYNAGLYIDNAIESVIVQTYTNWELIIINDGSTDNTAETISLFIDKRIKYIYQPNGGQGKARNIGIKNSKGKYIAFLDADDLWLKDKLKVQVEFMYENPKTDLVFSQGYYYSKDKKQELNVIIKKTWTNNDIGKFIECNMVPILSVLVKREALQAVNFFSEDPKIQNVEDYDLWIRLLLNNNCFSSISNRFFLYRIHDKQSTYNNKNTIIPMLYMFDNLYSKYEMQKWRKLILGRIKWALFKKESCLKAIDTGNNIIKKSQPVLSTILKKTASVIPNRMLTKCFFRIFSWV